MMLAAITTVILVAADVPALARVDQAAQKVAYQAQKEEQNAQQTVDQAVYQAQNAEQDMTQENNGDKGKRKDGKKTKRNMPDIDNSAISDAVFLALGSGVLLVPSVRRKPRVMMSGALSPTSSRCMPLLRSCNIGRWRDAGDGSDLFFSPPTTTSTAMVPSMFH